MNLAGSFAATIVYSLPYQRNMPDKIACLISGQTPCSHYMLKSTYSIVGAQEKPGYQTVQY